MFAASVNAFGVFSRQKKKGSEMLFLFFLLLA